jgi:acyl-CoA thioesterase II
MGDLQLATRVERTGPTSFTARLSADWEIWGPNGGYLASVALRAAGIQIERARPVSITAHFLGVAASREVDLEVAVNRATKVATSATVHLSQDGRPVLVATLWGTDDGLPGLVHQAARNPLVGVAHPETLPPIQELLADIRGIWSTTHRRSRSTPASPAARSTTPGCSASPMPPSPAAAP